MTIDNSLDRINSQQSSEIQDLIWYSLKDMICTPRKTQFLQACYQVKFKAPLLSYRGELKDWEFVLDKIQLWIFPDCENNDAYQPALPRRLICVGVVRTCIIMLFYGVTPIHTKTIFEALLKGHCSFVIGRFRHAHHFDIGAVCSYNEWPW